MAKLAHAKTSPEAQGPSETLGRLTADDIVKLNRNVGSAGFFKSNRIDRDSLDGSDFRSDFLRASFLGPKVRA